MGIERVSHHRTRVNSHHSDCPRMMNQRILRALQRRRVIVTINFISSVTGAYEPTLFSSHLGFLVKCTFFLKPF